MERRNRKDETDWSRLFILGLVSLLGSVFAFFAVACAATEKGWGFICFATLTALCFALTRQD